MTSILTITAAAVALPAAVKTAPEWLMYMPAGEQQIDAGVDGKPQTLTLTVTAADAATLQTSLEELRASGPAPFFGFDHVDGRASAWPQEFQWRETGIWARVRWTPDGTAGVTVPSPEMLPAYQYFSPGFRYDQKAKRIIGLIPGEAGSLVNNPAFREIAKVAAKNVPAPAGQPKNPDMKHTEIAEAVVKAGLLTEAEAAGDTAGTLTSERLTALNKSDTVRASQAADIQTWRARAEKAETTLTTMRESAAASAVAEAVRAGIIPAKDDKTQEFWRGAIIDHGDTAVKAMTAGKPVVPADSGAGSPGAATTPAQDDAENSYWDSVRAKAHEIRQERNIDWNSAFNEAASIIIRPKA